MSGAKTHARNLFANWTAHGATLVAMFFLSPFVIHSLGRVEYGIWSLLSVVTGYMGILDLGLRASTGRQIILYTGRQDCTALDETIRTSLGFFSGLGVLVIVAGGAIGYFLPFVYKSIPADYHYLLLYLVPALALNVWFSALQTVFSSVLVAFDRFDLARGVDLAVLSVQTTGTVVALLCDVGILGLAGVSVGCSALGVLGNYALARRAYPALRIWPLLLRRSRLNELFSYGAGAFISAIAFRLMGQADLLVAGAAFGVAAVTVFSVGAMLVYYSNTFLRMINSSLFPAIQRAVAAGDIGSARHLYLQASRVGLVLGLLVYVGLAMFSEPFIRLWMYGPDFDDLAVRQAASVMSLLAISNLPLLFVGASIPVLNAKGLVRLTASISACEAIVNLVVTLLFVFGFGWGFSGIPLGTLASRLFVGTFIAPRVACSNTGVTWRTYLVTFGGQSIGAGVCFALVCWVIKRYLPAGNWPSFFIQIALATTIYGLGAFCLLATPRERMRVYALYASRRKREISGLVSAADAIPDVKEAVLESEAGEREFAQS